jgi:hypothetical protein
MSKIKTNKMKKLVVLSGIAFTFIFAACTSQKIATSSYTDDVYANPKEVRAEEARIKEQQQLAKAAAEKRKNDSLAELARIQKEKDDANPYYKDREFKYDDYYDYEYATRLKRFDRSINGLGYYDNYYTNSYWYNNNPYNYGVSVYNGYSWWGPNYNYYSYSPSVSFYNSWGWGYGNNYGYSGYNPYMAGYAAGYNNGFNNGMYGNYYGYGNPYYSPYGYYGYGYGNYYGYGNPYYGYGYGYNSPYYNGWGYYNAYDYNSSYTYGPRTSHGGGNGRRTSNPGINEPVKRVSYSDQYINSIAQQQEHAVRFENLEPIKNTGNPNSNGNTGGIKPSYGGNNNTPIKDNSYGASEPIRSNPVRNTGTIKDNNSFTPGASTSFDEPTGPTRPIRNTPIKSNNGINTETPINNNTPIRNTPIRSNDATVKQNELPSRQQSPSFNSPSFPSNNGGGGFSSPGGGSGGGHRPR